MSDNLRYDELKKKVLDRCYTNNIPVALRRVIEREINAILTEEDITVSSVGGQRLLGDIMEIMVKEALDAEY